MSTQCLKKKLKSTVDNNNLVYYGGLKITFSQGYEDVSGRIIKIQNPSISSNLTFSSESPIDILFKTNQSTYSNMIGVTSGTINAGTAFVIRFYDTDNTVIIKGVNYSLVSLGIPKNGDLFKVEYQNNTVSGIKVDLLQCDYIPNIVEIELPVSTATGIYSPKVTNESLRTISNNNTSTIVNNKDFAVDIEAVHKYCKNVRSIDVKKTSSFGNIECLSDCISLTLLKFYDTYIYGDIYTLVATMAQNRTSGQLEIAINMNVMKYNGVTLTANVVKSMNNSNIDDRLKFKFGSSYEEGFTLVQLS